MSLCHAIKKKKKKNTEYREGNEEREGKKKVCPRGIGYCFYSLIVIKRKKKTLN